MMSMTMIYEFHWDIDQAPRGLLGRVRFGNQKLLHKGILVAT